MLSMPMLLMPLLRLSLRTPSPTVRAISIQGTCFTLSRVCGRTQARATAPAAMKNHIPLERKSMRYKCEGLLTSREREREVFTCFSQTTSHRILHESSNKPYRNPDLDSVACALGASSSLIMKFLYLPDTALLCILQRHGHTRYAINHPGRIVVGI